MQLTGPLSLRVFPGRLAAIALLAVCLLFLSGCAARQAPAPVPSPTPEPAPTALDEEPQNWDETDAAHGGEVVPGDAQALYQRLEDARLECQSGIDLLAVGEEVAGEERFARGINAISELAAECSAMAGCDQDIVLDSLFTLINEQNLSLKRRAYEVEQLEGNIERLEEANIEREQGTSSFAAAMPELEKTATLLKGTDLREIIELNGPVRAALDDWLTWLRPNLMLSYENYQFMRAEVAPVYENAGMPEALLFAIMATESHGKVHAVSRAGASGPLQFMRATGRRYGLAEVEGFDERFDPAKATAANVAYLNDLFGQLNDSLAKALAAYNAGEHRLHRIERRHGTLSLWDKRMYYALPTETRDYVPRVLAAAWLFLHPEEYQLEFPNYDTNLVEVELGREASVGELAICLGQEFNPNGWFRTVRNLNPELEPSDQVAAGDSVRLPAFLEPVYKERCLGGELVETALALHEANYPDEDEVIPYVVRRGDTLGKIASRNRCASLSELAALNRLRAPSYVIHVGQELKIPACN